MNLPWPSGIRNWELWAETALLWMIANYAFADPIGRQTVTNMEIDARRRWLWQVASRALAAAAVTLVLPGLHTPHLPIILMGVAMGTGIATLAVVRLQLLRSSRRWHRYVAEWEITANIATLVTIGIIIGYSNLSIERPLLVLPTTSSRVAAAGACMAAALFVVGGGTHIVRGVLDKVETLPKVSRKDDDDIGTSTALHESIRIDVVEYNRGRTIGNIERFLMLVIIGVGSYEALGLLIAAKGLIRAPEFEDRDFAEYFIVGSLASVAVALLVGIPLTALVRALWYK